MTTIPVDTNSMANDGLILASLRRASGPISVGETVEAIDIATGRTLSAYVEAVEGRRATLRINREDIALETPSVAVQRFLWSFVGDNIIGDRHIAVRQNTVQSFSTEALNIHPTVSQNRLATTA